MQQKPELSAWEYAALFSAIARTLATLLVASMTGPFRGKNGASTYKNHVMFSALKKFTSISSSRATQALAPLTSEAYAAFVKSHGMEPEIVDVGDTVGCWFGDKNADVCIVWLHGGGYASSASKAHIQLVWDLVMSAAEKNKKVSAFMLQYGLAPGAVHPQPLMQAAAALQYLTKDVGLTPSQLLLCGDSAGGNLALGLISHLLHPLPSLPPLDNSPFKGIALLSPWVTFDQTAASFKTNANKDILAPAALKKWSDAFMGNTPRDNYTYPLDAAPEWWQGLPAQSVLVLAGGDELFADDIEGFVKKLENGNKTEFLVADGECHDAPVVDAVFGNASGAQTRKLTEWVLKQI